VRLEITLFLTFKVYLLLCNLQWALDYACYQSVITCVCILQWSKIRNNAKRNAVAATVAATVIAVTTTTAPTTLLLLLLSQKKKQKKKR
jgi:hypothetical protein